LGRSARSRDGARPHYQTDHLVERVVLVLAVSPSNRMLFGSGFDVLTR
jgi:hypothetical protein